MGIRHSAPLRWAWIATLALTIALGVARAQAEETLSIGFTKAMFAGVNESDAKASIRALATTISRERGLPADPEPHLFRNYREAGDAFVHQTANMIGLTTAEYASLRERIGVAGFVFSVVDGDPSDVYVVLVSASDSATKLADLRGRDLAVLTGPRMSVATEWLDLELARAGEPPPNRFFRRQITAPKPAKAILPVFFKQVAACLVTKQAFDTMAELNPQIRAQIRVVVASPRYVPSFFAVRAGLSAPFLARVLREFDALHTTPAGRQVLTIFQTDRVVAKPEATLDDTLAMLEAHRRAFPDSATAIAPSP